jgi:hypothetical protein
MGPTVDWTILYASDQTAIDGPYHDFSFTNSTIHHAGYALGVSAHEWDTVYNRRLNFVTVSGNTVLCDVLYPNGPNGPKRHDPACRDGIHLNGRISGATVSNNTVSQRGDAAFALTSCGRGTIADSLATFGPMWTTLTPTNVTISNNTGNDDVTCLDFSGGHNVTATNSKCVDTIPITGDPPPGKPASGPSLRFVFGGFLPLPSNISVNGGTFSNVIGAYAENTNVKMDFVTFAVNGQYPACNCTVSNAQLGENIYMLGNAFTIDSSRFAPNTMFTIAAEGGDYTNAIIISNSTWGYPRNFNLNNNAGGISGSYLKNDTYNGTTTAMTTL